MTTPVLRTKVGVLVLFALAAVVMSWGPGAQVASACDCSGPGSDVEAVERSDAAFTGTLTDRIEPDPVVTSADPVRYVFDVQLVHKGPIGARVEVESALSSASCGAVISAEVPMFVVVRRDGDRYVTAQCSGTRPLTDADGPATIAGQPPPPSRAALPALLRSVDEFGQMLQRAIEMIEVERRELQEVAHVGRRR